jgi:hypothetical protein
METEVSTITVDILLSEETMIGQVISLPKYRMTT